MNKINIKTIFLVVILFLHCPPSYAIELFDDVLRVLDIDTTEFKNVVLGVGGFYSPSEYIGVDDEVWAVPIIVGKYKRFYSDGSSLGYILNDDENLYISLVGQHRFDGYDDEDSPELIGMQDREWSLDGGLRLSWNNDLFQMQITGVTDLLSKHDGHEVKAVLSREFFEGGFTPKIGARWLSDNLIEYYYGVAGIEAKAGRPAYEGDDTVNFIAGFTAAVPVGDNWAVIGDFEYTNYGSEIDDSPIVDEDDGFASVLGVVYRF